MSRIFFALLANIVVAGALTTTSVAGELHEAVRAHDVAKVRSILAAGAPVDESDFILGTALHVAIAQADTEICALLLDGGADVEAVSELEGSRPLHLAAELDDVEIASALLQKGAEVDSLDGNEATPLHRAAAGGYADIAELLLNAGADSHLPDGMTGGTPLHYAAQNGHLEVSKLLVQHGAPINAIDGVGNTPILLAASPPSFSRVGDDRLLVFLVANGADLSIRDSAGRTPLEYTRARSAYATWGEIADILERLDNTE